jgi:hypothetical protein
LSSEEELELKSPCITGLFASNETHFFDSVPKNAISGGFLARTFIIYEEKRINYNSLTGLTNPVPEKIDYLRIIGHLGEISKLEGEVIIEKEALEIYDKWYYDFSPQEHEVEDESATSERIGDNILKVGILIALANHQELIINVQDMTEAITKGMETFANIKKLLFGGTASSKDVRSLVMRTTIACILETKPLFECERKKILRKGIGIFGVYDLDECVEHLLQAGMIKMNKRGAGVYYSLTEMIIKRHQGIEEDNRHVN